MATQLIRICFTLVLLSLLISCEEEDTDYRNTTYEKPVVVKPKIYSMSYSVLNCSPPYQVLIKYTKNTSAPDTADQCTWVLYDSAVVYSCNDYLNDIVNTPGIYSVTLKISNSLGADSMKLNLDISGNSYPVSSAFTISEYDVYEDKAVSFFNQSERATSYNWDFGDGYSSSLTNPSHSYSTPGNYTVTLTATCTGQNETSTRSIKVRADPGYVYLDEFYLDLPISYLDSDGDDYNALPDYYIKIYVDGDLVKTTSTKYNIPSFPETWEFSNLKYHLGTNHTVEFKLYDYDSGSGDDYVYLFSFETNYLLSHNYPSGISLGSYGYCYLSY